MITYVFPVSHTPLNNYRHLYNFFLLFISNVENLLAFVLRDIIGATLMHRIEEILGILYLYLVISNLLWFLSPLKTREEYSSFISYAESCKKECIAKCNKMVSLLSFGLLPSKIMKMKESGGAAEIKRPTLRKHSSA